MPVSEAEKSALILVFDGVEEVEALAPVDILRRTGVVVTIASLGENKTVHGRNGISFLADKSFEEVKTESYDLFILPGGPGVLELVDDANLHGYIRDRLKANQLCSAICAAPAVFAAAGALDGKTATSHASVRDRLPQASDDKVVQDGVIITSQGAGTAVEFSLKLTEILAGKDQAAEVAASIHA